MMNDISLFALVLAAGSANRFGSTKQLATYGGESLVARAVRTAESICGSRTLLVVGNEHHAVTAACEPLRGFFTYNPRYSEGIASSIRSGVRCLANQSDGILLLLADQPLVDRTHLESLEEAWRSAPERICASAYANTLGPPAIFPRKYFAALTSLRGDRGAKSLLEINRDRLKIIVHEPGGVDIDVPADLEQLRD
ncbi:MAG: nucleotidyltransferase family protein [Woeseiaceae bacterium]